MVTGIDGYVAQRVTTNDWLCANLEQLEVIWHVLVKDPRSPSPLPADAPSPQRAPKRKYMPREPAAPSDDCRDGSPVVLSEYPWGDETYGEKPGLIVTMFDQLPIAVQDFFDPIVQNLSNSGTQSGYSFVYFNRAKQPKHAVTKEQKHASRYSRPPC